MTANFNSTFFFPAEGLDYMLNVLPRGTQAAPTTTYLGLTATPWSTISGWVSGGDLPIYLNNGDSGYDVLEVSDLDGYARIPLAASGWQAITSTVITINGESNIPVEQTTYSGALTWTNTGPDTASDINGIFVATFNGAGNPSGPGGDGAVLWYAPFSDLSTVTLASGDSLTVTPTWQSASYPY